MRGAERAGEGGLWVVKLMKQKKGEKYAVFYFAGKRFFFIFMM